MTLEFSEFCEYLELYVLSELSVFSEPSGTYYVIVLAIIMYVNNTLVKPL